MKHRHAVGALAILVSTLTFLPSLVAQNAPQPAAVGVVHDWTEHQIVYNRAALAKNPSLIELEPRVANHELARWNSVHPWVSGDARSTPPVGRGSHRDWNFDLGGGTARLAADMYPSKYSFDPGAPPDCNNDFLVLGFNRAGITGGQANLVAFNKLYAGNLPAGLCGLAPAVLFAYNVSTNGGRISTSPVLSRDGTKIAFVETRGGATPGSIFHVLTWAIGAGGGVVNNAADPGVNMTSLTYSPTLNTRSSPWVDYNSDTAYVGANDGVLYKITGVFNGTPTLAGSPWPITLSSGTPLSTPVLDKNLGLVLVGNQEGTYFSVDTTGVRVPTVRSIVVGVSAGTDPGILAPPIVDLSNGTSFVVSSNDGTSGVLVQVDSNTMTILSKARIGQASKSGTPVNLFQPAFDDAYYNNPSTGVARLCGTGASDVTPWQYSFGFTAGVLNTTPTFSAQLSASTTARCTGWTEFFNPNIGSTGTDFFFFGMTTECTGPSSAGCVVMRTDDDSFTPLQAGVFGGPSGIVVDNSSTAEQASSIYFTGASGPPNTAFKVTQRLLQ